MIADARRPPNDLAGYDPVATAPPGYHYDADAADLAVGFIESECVHVKGKRAGQPLLLSPWQQDIVRTAFGWWDKDGNRRYKIVYCEVPRKNGKSTLLAGIVLLNAFCPRFADEGAEMYSAAGDKEQAGLVYQIAAAMVRRNRLMLKRCKPRDSRKRIIWGESFYQAVAANDGAVHGYNPSFVAADELHTWRGDKGRGVWDGLLTGTAAEDRDACMFVITTAGYDRSSICWEQHQYALGVRDGKIDDASFLPVLYFADGHDDWTSPGTWAKANPNLGVSVSITYLERECARAARDPLYENTFRRLHLNQWTEQAVRWMPMESWRACPAGCDLSELDGEECYGGLDIASTRDLASFVLVFPRPDGTYRVLCWFFCPAEAVSKRAKTDRQGYAGWVGRYIQATPGNSIDQQAIRAVMWDAWQKYDLRCVHFDPHNMEECYQTLLREGWAEGDIVAFKQYPSNYNEPMKRCLELVRDKRLGRGDNPVLDWNASNVVAKVDAKGDIMPDKGKSQDKIDGFCALLMALSGAMKATDIIDYQSGGMF